jgi:hypothetical protein
MFSLRRNIGTQPQDHTASQPTPPLASTPPWKLKISAPLSLISFVNYLVNEPGSSVSIVSDYGLDDRAIEVRSPAEARIFPPASVSRPALGPTQPPVQWVPEVLPPGLKHGRGVTLTTHPHLVPKSRMSRNYTSSPPPQAPSWRVAGLLYLLVI